MSYRHDAEGRRAWRLWVDRHGDALLRCGLPEFIVSNEFRWFRFVEHDGLDWESGWNVSMLSPDQASALHGFLTGEYGGGEYRRLLRLLDESRRGSHPPDGVAPSGTDHPRRASPCRPRHWWDA